MPPSGAPQATEADAADETFLSSLSSSNTTQMPPSGAPQATNTDELPSKNATAGSALTMNEELSTELRACAAANLETSTCVLDAAVWLLQHGALDIPGTREINAKKAPWFASWHRLGDLAPLWFRQRATRLRLTLRLGPRTALRSYLAAITRYRQTGGNGAATAKCLRPLLAAPNDHVLVLLGGAGIGKTHLILTIETLFQHFCGPGCMKKGAPTITAARILGGNTIHALHRLPRGHLTDRRSRLSSLAIAKLRHEWQNVVGHVADEVGMIPPKLLHQIDMRTRTAKRSSETFGHLWTALSGDFMQLPPVGHPSLAADACADDPAAPKVQNVGACQEAAAAAAADGEYSKQPSHAARSTDPEQSLGSDLWRQLTNVVILDVNLRTSGTLKVLLHGMRSGAIPDDVWPELEGRQLQPQANGEPDPRLHAHPFDLATMRCIVHRHSLGRALAYSLALRSATKRKHTFYVLHAADQPCAKDAERFSDDTRRKVLQIANTRHTAELPGLLPLSIGQRYRLHNNKSCVRLGLMNGAEVELVAIQFSSAHDPGKLNVLRYMPDFLVLRALGTNWSLPKACQHPALSRDAARGTFIVEPVTSKFTFADTGSRELTLTRTMFPLLPANCSVVYGAQGETATAVLADLACPPRMAPELHWLACYVMLSRATSLQGLLLLRNASREELERGAPSFIVDEIDRLLALERSSAQRLRQQLEKSKAIPPEILELFTDSLAARQRATNQQRGQDPDCVVTRPHKRLRGKQPLPCSLPAAPSPRTCAPAEPPMPSSQAEYYACSCSGA
ncbi:PIF1 [Symbiodinium sp. CCMP2592]|nr:PIF1 [Symbiodinium sp. CCMP2592]